MLLDIHRKLVNSTAYLKYQIRSVVVDIYICHTAMVGILFYIWNYLYYILMKHARLYYQLDEHYEKCVVVVHRQVSNLLVIYYDGENKLDFDEMMKMSALYSLSWFRGKLCLILLINYVCFADPRYASNINFIIVGFTRARLEIISYHTRDEYSNY